MANQAFQFVDTSEASNNATRRLIRKQAMIKTAAERRESKTWGKWNLRQDTIVKVSSESNVQTWVATAAASDQVDQTDAGLSHGPAGCKSKAPVCPNLGPIHESHQDGTYASQRSQRQGFGLSEQDAYEPEAYREDLVNQPLNIPPRMPSSGYELLRIRHGIDLLDLSSLTTFHVGRVTSHVLHDEPSRLHDILRCRQWSYFSYLPARYGHDACLDIAAECVAKRVQYWLAYGSAAPGQEVLALYTRALVALRAKLADPVERLRPEVLCATQMLAIHELLSGPTDQSWVQHTAGSTSLMRHRGAGSYKSDFEKGLFLAQVGATYTEALLNDLPCFLEEQPWQDLLKSVVIVSPEAIPEFSDCSESSVSLWTCVCVVPRLFSEVQDVVCHGTGHTAGMIQALQAQILHAHDRLVLWCCKYEPFVYASSPSHTVTSQIGPDKRYETLGVCLVNLIILKRLTIALSPATESHLEDEIQALVMQILDLSRLASAVNARAQLFMAFKLEAARATFQTSDEWRFAPGAHDRLSQCTRNGLIAKRVFEHWCELKGREFGD